MKVLIFMVAVLIAAIEICAQVQTVDLGGHLAWKVFDANLNVSTFGTVPGCVHTDLLNAGLIDEPYYRYNQRQYLWIAESDWTYTRQFTLTSDFVALPALLLVTEGLDTVATVKINDVLVGQGENSHLRYEWDIKHAVQVGTNTIVVQFTSAVKYGAAQAAQYPYEVPYVQFPDQIDNRPFVRKAQSHFAWDWGPAFATMGIWRNISLVGFTDVWMSDIVVTTAPDAHTGDFTVNFSAYVRSIGNFQNALLNAIGASAENSCLQDITLQSSRIDCAMTVVQPPLWWPNGYGNPTLHDLIVELKVNGHVQSKKVRVGFRTFEVVEDPLPDGQTFYFKVNNVPIFIKGVNVVPADSFESRINPSTWGWLMDSARDSHMNMLRVWGGGIYQPDYFYDLCDEKGLMVWQEFLYACAMYPRNTAFLQTVTAETVYNAKRLSYHASLMLWGGNNENEVGFGWYAPTKATPTLYAIDYDILYVQTVRAALLSVDNSRAFRTSSPTAGTFTNDPYVTRWGQVGNFYGDVHYYNGVDKVTDVTKIPKPRFASEYGFQSYPSVYTLAPVTVPSDLQWNSPLMVFRQHSPPSQTQVANQLAMLFRVPPDSDYKSFYYLSQCVQAEGYKTTITLWRRQKAQAAHTMGVMYWQLNDIWQAPTWASIQYDGRWKMLQNYIQRIYAPVIVCAQSVMTAT
eukprot:TRINITY_DN3979_c0_g1_i4.p1 TRINITY_DN3979_c0_g1~~TRINITY_DN3979_c0_g1_i4.p1  ORF type:complete len:684 (-),score=136.11 TRINITY_DN3979_c0_g1_i4:579-2630(-)